MASCWGSSCRHHQTAFWQAASRGRCLLYTGQGPTQRYNMQDAARTLPDKRVMACDLVWNTSCPVSALMHKQTQTSRFKLLCSHFYFARLMRRSAA